MRGAACTLLSVSGRRVLRVFHAFRAQSAARPGLAANWLRQRLARGLPAACFPGQALVALLIARAAERVVKATHYVRSVCSRGTASVFLAIFYFDRARAACKGRSWCDSVDLMRPDLT